MSNKQKGKSNRQNVKPYFKRGSYSYPAVTILKLINIILNSKHSQISNQPPINAKQMYCSVTLHSKKLLNCKGTNQKTKKS